MLYAFDMWSKTPQETLLYQQRFTTHQTYFLFIKESFTPIQMLQDILMIFRVFLILEIVLQKSRTVVTNTYSLVHTYAHKYSYTHTKTHARLRIHKRGWSEEWTRTGEATRGSSKLRSSSYIWRKPLLRKKLFQQFITLQTLFVRGTS